MVLDEQRLGVTRVWESEIGDEDPSKDNDFALFIIRRSCLLVSMRVW